MVFTKKKSVAREPVTMTEEQAIGLENFRGKEKQRKKGKKYRDRPDFTKTPFLTRHRQQVFY